MMELNSNDVERLEKTGDLKPLKSNIIYLRTHFITKILTDEDDAIAMEQKAISMKAVNVQIVQTPQKVFNAMFQTEKQALDFAKSL